MKRIILAAIFLSIFHLPSCTLHGQNVGINSTGASPNASSLLDIDASPASNKGLLIPRVSFAQRTGLNFNPLPAAAQGLLIYQTDAGGFGEGFYYNTSVTNTPTWVKLFTSTTGWSLTGNVGTSGGPNFLGTTDNISLRFRTNSTQKMIIDSLGNVGIGTTSPQEKLTVGSGGTFAVINTANWDHLRMFHNGAVGFIDAGGTENGLAFRVDGSAVGYPAASYPEIMRLLPSGNVGIGTANPLRLLHISQSLTSASTLLAIDNPDLTNTNGSVISFRGNTTGAGASSFVEFSAIQHTISLHDHPTRTSDMAFFTTNSGTLQEAVRIKGSGNVGIGTTVPTLNTTGKVLHLHEPSNAASAIHFTNLTTGSGATNGFVMGRWTDGSYGNGIILWNYDATPITFSTAAVERMYIAGGGNVGIGTTSPIGLLHILGGPAMTSGYNRNTVFHANHPTVQFKGISDSNRSAFIGYDAQTSSEALRFWVGANGDDPLTGTSIQAMTIKPSGNVGIGTTLPGARLEVAGQVKITGGSPAAGKVLTSDGTGLATWAYPANPWENMGTNIQQVCAGGTAATDYEWGVQYNNSSPIIRVTCTGWNTGSRVCTYPPYPTGDAEPFNWGGACWIWGTNSAWDDACSGAGQAYHSYYFQNANGVYYMAGGNGCGSLPTVYRRKL